MNPLTAIQVTFTLAPWIAKGLQDGTLQRVGGIIVDVGSKRIVAWLREFISDPSQVPATNAFSAVLGNLIPGANLIGTVVNAAVTGKGLADVNKRLGGIAQQIGNIQQGLQQTQGILQVASAVSVLNLGVSVMGFAVIAHRIKELEKSLQQAQEILNKVNRKIDLGFYANFRAGIDLAVNAFTMTQPETRKSMAIQAINRFLEAEHIYTDYTDAELEQKSQIVDEYLLTLSLAYLAEARCYLELEEIDTARRRLQEGSTVLRSRIQRYVDILLTSNPAAYLHPEFKDKIDLTRLTRIYQWIDPTLNENAVFQMQRENLVNFVQDSGQWLKSLPPAILDRSEIKFGLFGRNPTPLTGRFEKEAFKRLPQTLELMESVIETNQRFEVYQAEIQAISKLGMNFQKWQQLVPAKEVKPDSAALMYIIPSQPVDVGFSN